jgi:hypothetical protein
MNKKLKYKRVICVLCYFGHKTVHKFVQIHMNTPNIFTIEDFMTLSLPKMSSR